ncbi:arginine--tRNA ligase [Candidatus Woesearchaeota archaeon]|nr:arginine--tRNA ligase [Candidatus Woesearchaeota archaeon]
MDGFKQEIVKALKKELKISEQEISDLMEMPSNPELGDYAFPCFRLAGVIKKAPNKIASELQEKVKAKNVVEVRAAGPYLNFFVDKKELAKATIEKILAEKKNFGRGSSSKKIVIEYPSPNTNKPLHLGHVRNMLLGKSVSRLLEFQGNKVIQVNLNNDRGVHICKAMLAYKLWGEGRKPEKKPDHFVGDFYVLYAKKAEEKPELEEEVQTMLRKWEKGDKETIELWKKISGWAKKGFEETYEKFGIKFEKTYNESEHYKEGKQIVKAAFKDGMLKKDKEGNIIAELKKKGLPDKVLLRKDGTSVYMTQDINLAKIKYKDFRMDRSIYVVGTEQILHFKQLLKIIDILKIKAGELYHLAYGMVYLPEGRMKSREGKVVDADDLVEGIIALAKDEVKKRHELKDGELDERAKQIGMGALNFFILKYDTPKDFIFNPEESIALEGETGPYIQYAHARICSVFKKHGKSPAKIDYEKLKEKEEIMLLKILGRFPHAAKEAAEQYKPQIVSRYLLELSQQFNEFYHQHQVLKAEDSLRDTRLALLEAVRQVIRNGLYLLSIDAPEEM